MSFLVSNRLDRVPTVTLTLRVYRKLIKKDIDLITNESFHLLPSTNGPRIHLTLEYSFKLWYLSKYDPPSNRNYMKSGFTHASQAPCCLHVLAPHGSKLSRIKNTLPGFPSPKPVMANNDYALLY